MRVSIWDLRTYRCANSRHCCAHKAHMVLTDFPILGPRCFRLRNKGGSAPLRAAARGSPRCHPFCQLGAKRLIHVAMLHCTSPNLQANIRLSVGIWVCC